jgi:nucleoporin GLE1
MKSAYQLEDSADVNIYEFIFNPPKGEAQGSALLIYFLNILAKKLVAQLARESGVSAKLADAIGILGSTIFAQDDCHIKGHHMGDIVLAKFHRDCPVLFGIYGPEDTDAGKARLGWAKEGQKGQQNWVDFQTHLTNMTGYGVGFAALTLRNYEKSKNQNPLPVYHFWRAVALITNTPDNEITNTHCIVLKAMIENNEERIVQFFGDFGLALMKRALIEFPLRAGQSEKGNVAAKAMLALAEKMEKEKGVYLM